jgi:CHAD domain-containing protein
MADFDKWLMGIAPDDPADRVAWAVLTTRFAAVKHFLAHAAAGATSAENVHQLRIWTRRTATALKLFKPAIPKSDGKWTKKTLRKLRRLAGFVRDCDVYLDRLKRDASRLPKRLMKQVRKERRVARKDLKAGCRRLQRKDRFERRADALLKGIVWPKRHSSREAPPFAVWCRGQLAPLGERFFALAGDDLNDDAKLHEFRIAAKRLRYTLELAGPAIGSRNQRQIYDALSSLQDRVGEVRDLSNAVSRLRNSIRRARKSERRKLEAWVEREEEALGACREGLLKWWSKGRQLKLSERWRAVLGE